MKRLLFAGLVGWAIAVAPPAGAAPVARNVNLELSLTLSGLNSFLTQTNGFYYRQYGPLVNVQSTGTVSVDSAAGTIGIAAGVIALQEPLTVFIDATTSLNSVRVGTLSNLAGIFSVGGAGGQAGEPPCPPTAGSACVGQSGLGGPMGLVGLLELHIVPNVVVLPVNLQGGGVGVGGTATNVPFTFDAAPWTVGTGLAQGASPLTTITGSVGTDRLRLVSPTYLFALGNVFPIASELTITFTDGLGVPGFVSGMVPEPGLLLLLGFATAALVWAGRR